MAWVIEMTGHDPVAGVAKVVRFSLGEGIAFTDADYAPGSLVSWNAASQRIDFNEAGEVQISGGAGEVVLANYPDSTLAAGPLDFMVDWIFQNRPVALYWVPRRLWSERVLMSSGVLEQPVESLAITSGLTSTIRLPIRDPRAALETPLQPVLYAGTAVGPNGVEGGAALKGKPKPVLYGLVSNFAPPLVNESLLIYQLADKPVKIICVRDGGVPLAAGTVRASLDSLRGNVPGGGGYDIYRGAEGTFIKLGSRPVYGIACDADEASNVANQSHARIWSRIRAERIGGTTVAASITAADAQDANGAGFYWSTEITQKAALDEVLRSFSGFEVQDTAGAWSVGKLVAPTGTPVLDLVQLTPQTRRRAITRALRGLTKVRPRYAPDGAPPFRVNVQWGRNYTVMDERAFAGVVGDRLRQKFAEEYRVASASNNAIWNPVTKTGPWTSAPELTIRTGYQPGADGLSDAAAAAEAARILALLGSLRGQYQTAHTPEVGENVQPGMVVRVTHPRRGMAAGALFRILEEGLTVDKDGARRDLVIGLQS